jgi:hypothetical protein
VSKVADASMWGHFVQIDKVPDTYFIVVKIYFEVAQIDAIVYKNI